MVTPAAQVYPHRATGFRWNSPYPWFSAPLHSHLVLRAAYLITFRVDERQPSGYLPGPRLCLYPTPPMKDQGTMRNLDPFYSRLISCLDQLETSVALAEGANVRQQSTETKGGRKIIVSLLIIESESNS